MQKLFSCWEDHGKMNPSIHLSIHPFSTGGGGGEYWSFYQLTLDKAHLVIHMDLSTIAYCSKLFLFLFSRAVEPSDKYITD